MENRLLEFGKTDGSRALDVLSDSFNSYVARIENEETETGVRCLRLKIGVTGNPAATNLWAEFVKSSGGSLGSIGGDGSGGVSFNESSDRRLKYNIHDTKITIDDLDEVRITGFTRGGVKSMAGVIAQELEETKFKDFVTNFEEFNKQEGLKEGDKDYQYMQVGYNKFIPILIKSVQDANKMIKELQQEVKELKSKING